MHSFFFLAAAAASMFSAVVAKGVANYSPGDPVIHIINTSTNKTHVYKVEANQDNPPSAIGSGGTEVPLITVKPGKTVEFYPGRGFIGAISARKGEGTRFEVNFRGDSPGDYKTWYNSDMEFGMSDTTLAPTNGAKQINGDSAVAGEQDCLAAANAVWGDVDTATQQQLLNTGYLEGSTGGNGALTAVHMDKNADLSIVEFFQSTAHLNAYLNPGSGFGTVPSRLAAIADTFSWSVKTKDLTITGY
ncbi:MAG: hypothetical protein LQ351_005600 [Letrouitia transgressa]|nr:MAG: hypothetical protein LQ351_005600 [Letrouitia transgressa]